MDKRLCVVYSMGINNNWSFDEAMAEYGCRMFSFDRLMNGTDQYHCDHSRFIYFFYLGLSDRDHVIDGDGGKWT